jgi:hypothetical protein
MFPVATEARPTSYPMGTGGPFPGGKARPERDADHLPFHCRGQERVRAIFPLPFSPCMASSGTALLLLFLLYVTKQRGLTQR